MSKKHNEKEELTIFLKTLETERYIWRGIARRKLFVVDKVKDRNIGKTIALKNIAEAIDVKVLVESSKKAKFLNEGHRTTVFIGQGKDIESMPDFECLIDEDVDFKELDKTKNVKIIGGIYAVDTARYVTFKDIMALER